MYKTWACDVSWLDVSCFKKILNPKWKWNAPVWRVPSKSSVFKLGGNPSPGQLCQLRSKNCWSKALPWSSSQFITSFSQSLRESIDFFKWPRVPDPQEMLMVLWHKWGRQAGHIRESSRAPLETPANVIILFQFSFSVSKGYFLQEPSQNSTT